MSGPAIKSTENFTEELGLVPNAPQDKGPQASPDVLGRYVQKIVTIQDTPGISRPAIAPDRLAGYDPYAKPKVI
jgi:hypothetical protein